MTFSVSHALLSVCIYCLIYGTFTDTAYYGTFKPGSHIIIICCTTVAATRSHDNRTLESWRSPQHCCTTVAQHKKLQLKGVIYGTIRKKYVENKKLFHANVPQM